MIACRRWINKWNEWIPGKYIFKSRRHERSKCSVFNTFFRILWLSYSNRTSISGSYLNNFQRFSGLKISDKRTKYQPFTEKNMLQTLASCKYFCRTIDENRRSIGVNVRCSVNETNCGPRSNIKWRADRLLSSRCEQYWHKYTAQMHCSHQKTNGEVTNIILWTLN